MIFGPPCTVAAKLFYNVNKVLLPLQMRTFESVLWHFQSCVHSVETVGVHEGHF